MEKRQELWKNIFYPCRSSRSAVPCLPANDTAA
jgi:hypothetical protein